MFPFREVWCADFEYRSLPGERPRVACLVAQELISGHQVRMWRDELQELRRAPFDTGPDVALVAYYASSEIQCFLELDWPLPANVIDLFAEHRVETNGRASLLDKKLRNKLLGALAIRGLGHIDVGEKKAMIDLINSKEWWEFTEEERRSILDYCTTDVIALIALLPVMAPTIQWKRAQYRGRYMVADARMVRTGIPMDVPLHRRVLAVWEPMKLHLIDEVNPAYGVYENGVFKRDRFARYLAANNIPWPRHPSGTLMLDDDTFDDQATAYPQLRPLYELHATLSRLRLTDLEIGSDNHNRCMLSAFSTVTGRNAPSTNKLVFGPARWIRGLIRPEPGWAIACVDWAQQEFAISAALSGDTRMMEAYLSGDVYLAFAKAAGLVPPDATKHSHKHIREVCKQIILGISYGMGAASLAFKAGVSEVEARELLRLHRATYSVFWRWSDETVDAALFSGKIYSEFGWRRYVEREPNVRSLMNFKMQAGGAAMMQLGAIAGTEANIEIGCPIHDAFLISAPVDRIDEDVARMREIMSKAGRAITGGFEVRTDEPEIVRSPGRYMDDRGAAMWGKVMTLLEAIEERVPGSHEREPTFSPARTDLPGNEMVDTTFS